MKVSEIIVTGDVTLDVAIINSQTPGTNAKWQSEKFASASVYKGGAALLGELIARIQEKINKTKVIERINIPKELPITSDKAFHKAFSDWGKFPQSSKSSAKVYRIEKFLGVDRSENMNFIKHHYTNVKGGASKLIVIDDANLGFNSEWDLWNESFYANNAEPWVIFKTTVPGNETLLWSKLKELNYKRLIVITTANDLRNCDVQISKDVSWEKTTEDLLWEFSYNPTLKSIAEYATVIVSFDAVGSFVYDKENGSVLLYDPNGNEQSYYANYAGRMIGYTSCLTAAIAKEIIENPETFEISKGIQNGISAMRKLLNEGYTFSDGKLDFPYSEIVEEILKNNSPLLSDFQIKISKSGDDNITSQYWTMLGEKYKGNLKKLAENIVYRGLENSDMDAPIKKIGHLSTVDRKEIESFGIIQSLISEYCSKSKQKRPLSLAVFGAPGSGKSFGISQIADALFKGVIKKIEFNLSQLNGVDDFHNALHQVRDLSLTGYIPLVFWDEFDTALEGQPLGWLRHFLAPMQDGAFQSGQVVHPIGQAIFVFAGGTSETMDGFGKNLDETTYRSAKVPDFVSRLKGFVNILGPNPYKDDVISDPHYIIRRAILLRSMLQNNASQCVKDGKLSIDSGILNAFLRIGKYKHGARSMETIITMSQLQGKKTFNRSSLPPTVLLDLHVNGQEFMSLVGEIKWTPHLIEELAKVQHEQIWCKKRKEEGFVYSEITDKEKKASHLLVDYEKLSEEDKKSSRDTIKAIPEKLNAAGYFIVPKRGDTLGAKFTEEEIEFLAEKEHEIWMKEKIKRGWQFNKNRNDELKHHDCLIEWAELPEEQRQKDRDNIIHIPHFLSLAGYTIEKITG